MDDSPLNADLSAVPVFPLPSVVLLPTAVLPLHIFEDRYRAMTRAALIGDRMIAMALLSPGWQKTYHTMPAIEPVVCVGKIISHEQLPDGKYNFLLQGHTRAKVIREVDTREPFRRLELQPIVETPVDECDLLPARQSYAQVFEAGFLASTPVGKTFAKLLNSSLKTADIADLIAYNCLDDLTVKQALLAEGHVARRVQMITQLLLALQPDKTWPTNRAYQNPGMN